MQIDPADRTVFGPGEPLRWTVTAGGAATAGQWTLDGGSPNAMVRAGEAWLAELDRDEVAPGAHVLRLALRDAEGRVSTRTVAFYVNGGAFDVQWRQRPGGSSQSTPAVTAGRVFVGDNHGALSVFDITDGSRVATVETGGEVRSAAVRIAGGEAVAFGSADGIVRAVTPDGDELWRYDAGSAIYGSPTARGDRVFFGTEDGEVVALETADGSCAWRAEAAEYAIERAPAVVGDGLFVGAWDRHAYALDGGSGEVRWRKPSAGSDREGFVAWYYSPADCPPAVAGRNVFFADRAYMLTVFDAATGERILDEERSVAVGPSGDGQFVYVRHTDDRVSKRRADGSVAWEAGVPTGAVATPPVESYGIAWVISDRGTLTALDAASGEILAQQRITPDLFAFAAPTFDGERLYVADMGGRLTCFRPTWLAR
jgi:outer membrane protein assembly factor BamB